MCLERGGNSTNHKGVLAQFLGTNIPSRGGVCLCHACNNPKCSEPQHLYWGSYSDNEQDAIKNGKLKPYQYVVEKHGTDVAKKLMSNNGRLGGMANRNKPKSDEHRKKISDSLKRKFAAV